MEDYNFSYEIPKNFQIKMIRFLENNGGSDVAKILKSCQINYEDLGYAYYAGMKGDNWNKCALDFTIEGSSESISELKSQKQFLKERIRQFLKPSITGYLIRNLELLVVDGEIGINLPDAYGDTFETLSKDIYDSLAKNEPTLVLDRLYTYSTKFLRDICKKHAISITDDKGRNYALHSLAGALAKYYEANKEFQSDFVYLTLKETPHKEAKKSRRHASAEKCQLLS